MSIIVLAASLLAQPAVAHQGHAQHSAPAAPAAAAAKSVTVTIDGTTIGELLANPTAKAIIERHIPGFSSHPQIGMAARMTLKDVQPYSQGQITDDHLRMIAAEFAALNK